MVNPVSIGTLVALTVGASGCVSQGDDCLVNYDAPDGVFECSGTRIEFKDAQSALVVVAADGTMHWEKWEISAYPGLHVAFGRNATAADSNDRLSQVGFSNGQVEVGQFISVCGTPTDRSVLSFHQPVWDFSIGVDVHPKECGGH